MQVTFDLNAVAKSFSCAADDYDKAALLQQEVARRLCDRLDFMRITPATILDLGCGTGALHPQLCHRYPAAKLIGLDIAEGMCLRSSLASHSLRADAHNIPLQDNSVDLVFSNLMVHWCHDKPKVFQEIARVLKPGGLLIYTSLGPDTLCELRQAFESVDDVAHVHAFDDMHDYGDLMLKTSFVDPVTDMERIIIQYDAVLDLMRDLKQIGARNQHPNRRKTLTGKDKLSKLKVAYESHRNQQHKLPATYEVIYGHAWGSDLNAELISAAEEVNIPIETLTKMLKQNDIL